VNFLCDLFYSWHSPWQWAFLLWSAFVFFSRWHSEKLTPTLKSACAEFYDPPILRLLIEKLMTRAFVLVRAYSPDCGRSIRLESMCEMYVLLLLWRCSLQWRFVVYWTCRLSLGVSRVAWGVLPTLTRVPKPLRWIVPKILYLLSLRLIEYSSLIKRLTWFIRLSSLQNISLAFGFHINFGKSPKVSLLFCS